MALDVAEILLDDTEENAPPPDREAPSTSRRGRRAGSGATSRKAKPAPAPRATGTRELAQLLARAIGFISIPVALALAAEEAAMTPQEASDIARPAARLLAKSKWAALLMEYATGSRSDWGKLIFAVLMYGARLAPLMKLRYDQLKAQRVAQQSGVPLSGFARSEDAPVRSAQPVAQAASGSGNSNGHSPAVANDAARFAGLGLADVDSLAGGAYSNVAAIVAAVGAQ